ncbi:11976_t:CDS:2, partial [Ambispora leptoticha]
EYRTKTRASLIPENTKQSWYETAAKHFPYFDHCAGYWPFEEALRQRRTAKKEDSACCQEEKAKMKGQVIQKKIQYSENLPDEDNH